MVGERWFSSKIYTVDQIIYTFTLLKQDQSRECETLGAWKEEIFDMFSTEPNPIPNEDLLQSLRYWEQVIILL